MVYLLIKRFLCFLSSRTGRRASTNSAGCDSGIRKCSATGLKMGFGPPLVRSGPVAPHLSGTNKEQTSRLWVVVEIKRNESTQKLTRLSCETVHVQILLWSCVSLVSQQHYHMRRLTPVLEILYWMRFWNCLVKRWERSPHGTFGKSQQCLLIHLAVSKFFGFVNHCLLKHPFQGRLVHTLSRPYPPLH